MRNILYEVEGEETICKVSDFGLSVDLNGKNELRVDQINFQLPVKWSAPELLVKDASILYVISSKCDIWSFGILLYELFSNKDPWSDSSNEEVILKLTAGKTMPIDVDLPDIIRQLIDKCLKIRDRLIGFEVFFLSFFYH